MSETTRELTCIGCPLGCSITVTMNGTDVVSVTGNTCPRGDAYARRSLGDVVSQILWCFYRL